MWNEYFSNSIIVGIEVNVHSINTLKNDVPFNENTNTLDIILGDATDENILEKLKDYKFDIIIDDGSHFFNDQVKSFKLLNNKMNLGGIYIIEDVIDIDSKKQSFINLHHNSEIIDNRYIKDRSDDVLIIYKF
jgi:tRNA G37 N-methylase Trm5